jgi:hypothetical protein
MSVKTIEQRVLSLLTSLESSGRFVTSVAVEGRRIEFVLASGESLDDFDGIDMRHGKT